MRKRKGTKPHALKRLDYFYNIILSMISAKRKEFESSYYIRAEPN